MDYSKGKIYKIIDLTNDDIYIGSTTKTLKQRWNNHSIFREYDKKRKDCKIFLIEDYPCESRRQLEEREQYYMDNTECINRSDAVANIENKRRYQSQYHEINKEHRNERQKVNHQLRMKDQSYRDKKKDYGNKIKSYQVSWGGRLDQDNLCMLRIDPYLFL